MRPAKENKSIFMYPLDAILGSPAAIRLLRVLIYESDGAISVPEASLLAGLTQAGTRRALERLCHRGILRRSGSGRSYLYEVHADGPFVGLLAQLFEEENRQYQALFADLRDTFALPEVLSAWMAPLSESAAEVIAVTVVATPTGKAALPTRLSERLDRIKDKYGISVDISVFIQENAPLMEKNAQLIWGAAISSGPQKPLIYSREELIDFVVTQPQIVSRAKHYLQQQMKGEGAVDLDINEWLDVLRSYSPDQLTSLLKEGTERAERLWRSAPFVAVITNDEWSLLQQKA